MPLKPTLKAWICEVLWPWWTNPSLEAARPGELEMEERNEGAGLQDDRTRLMEALYAVIPPAKGLSSVVYDS